MTSNSQLLKTLLMTLLIVWIRFYSQERPFGARSYVPSNLTGWTKDPNLIQKIEQGLINSSQFDTFIGAIVQPVGLLSSSAQRSLFLILLILRVGILKGPVQGFYYN